jgi:hypothetical protein
VLDGEVRHMALLKRANGEWVIVVARNSERLQLIRALRYTRPTVPVTGAK